MSPKSEKEMLVFCRNVKKLREVKRLSKRDMERHLRIGIATLNKIENGIYPPQMKWTVLLSIHESFGITPEGIFSEELRIP